jgi:hypothetical protein
MMISLACKSLQLLYDHDLCVSTCIERILFRNQNKRGTRAEQLYLPVRALSIQEGVFMARGSADGTLIVYVLCCVRLGNSGRRFAYGLHVAATRF